MQVTRCQQKTNFGTTKVRIFFFNLMLVCFMIYTQVKGNLTSLAHNISNANYKSVSSNSSALWGW